MYILGSTVRPENFIIRHKKNIYKPSFIFFIALAAIILGFGLVKALSDTTPPTVTDISFSDSNSFDVTNSGGAAHLNANFTDDLSGVNNANIVYNSPSGIQQANGGFSQNGDGSWTTGFVVQQYAEAGTWTPTLFIQDNTGNTRTYTNAQLQSLGFNLTLNITDSNQDTVAPTITDLALTQPSSVDVSNGEAAIHLNGDFADNLSGLNSAIIFYKSPSGNQQASGGFSQNPDGSWTTGVLVPTFSEAGTWVPSSLTLSDNTGNVRTYTGAQLVSYNLNFSVVDNNADTSAPVVNNLTFAVAHPAVEAPFAGAVVTLSGNFSDNLSGFNGGFISYASPSGHQSATGGFNLNSDGTSYQGSVTIPSYAESGTWLPTLTLQDNAGNSHAYSATELANLGFSVKFDVYKSVAQTVAPGGTLSSDVENDGTTPSDPVEASVTTPSGGPVSITLVSSDAITDQANGYTFFGRQISIVAPVEQASNPLTISFQIDPSVVPTGQNASTLQVSKNGTLVPSCADQTTASPDPCVFSRVNSPNGGIQVSIHSTTASLWNSGFPTAHYDWGGFKGPIKDMPIVNSQGAGSNADVQFSLQGDKGLKVLAAGSPSSKPINCNTHASIGSSQSTVTDKNGLTYDKGSKYYHYHWATNKIWKNSCRELDITLSDGSVHAAYIKFN